jgi:hypothetical protein
MTVSDDLAAEIKARVEKATPGSWSAKAIAEVLKVGQEHLPFLSPRKRLSHDQIEADAEFIACARNGDVTALLSDRSSRIARAEAMAMALEAAQWQGPLVAGKATCPDCGCWEDGGHALQCELATALAAYRSGT